MATKTFCDRCDKEIKPAYTVNTLDLTSGEKNIGTWIRDICTKCRKDLLNNWWTACDG